MNELTTLERSTPRRQKAEERREEILDAALKIFCQKGFSAASIREITREAGITEGLLYHYFESKDNLIQVIWRERNLRPQLGHLLTQTDGIAVSDVLRRLFRDLLNTLYERRHAVRLFLSEMQYDPVMAAEYRNRNEENERPLVEFLRTRQEAGEIRPEADVKAAVALLTGNVRSLFLLWGQEPPDVWQSQVEYVVNENLDVILHGLT